MPTLNTRIRLKYDTLTNWTTANPTLLSGEVAVVAIPTSETSTVGQVTKPAIVFKVGDGETAFNDLPYASALSADVYSWAKAATKPTYTATEVGAATLADITSAIQALDSTASISEGNFITGFDVVDGKVTNVTYGAPEAVEIPTYTLTSTSEGKVTITGGDTDSTVAINGFSTIAGLARGAVQTVANGTANGTILVDGAAVSVGGLGSAAYTAASAYATSAQGDLADTAVQPEDLGTLASLNTITDAQVSATANIAQSKINGLTTALNNKANSSTVSAMNTRLNAAEDAIDTLETKVGDLGNALHFVGAGTYANIPSTGEDGDVYVVTGTSEANSGKEYVWANGAWNEFGDTSDYMLSSTATATFVPQTRTVNGHALSANITLDADDVGAATSSDITNAINALDMAALSVGAGYTINSISQTNGVVSANRVAIAINANQVTAGTFADARIPTLAISKINGLQTELDSKLESADLSGYVRGTNLTNNTIVLGNASSNIKASAFTISNGALTSSATTVVPTSNAVATYVTGRGYQTAAQVNSLVNAILDDHAGIDKVGTVTSVAGANGIKVTGTATTTPVVEIDTSAVFILNCGTASENIE